MTGPLEAKVDLTPGFLGTAGPVVAGAVLEDRGFLDANGEALDEVVVADEAGLDVAAFRAAVAAVVRLANGAREAVVAGLVVEEAVGAEIEIDLEINSLQGRLRRPLLALRV